MKNNINEKIRFLNQINFFENKRLRFYSPGTMFQESQREARKMAKNPEISYWNKNKTS